MDDNLSVAKVTPKHKINPKDSCYFQGFDSIENKIKEIHDFNFPFIDGFYDKNQLENMIESVKLLKKKSDSYISFLENFFG